MKILLCGLVFAVVIMGQGCKDNGPVNNYYYTTSDQLSDPNVKPAVIFTNPANGAVGPFTPFEQTLYPQFPLITIQLNKLVNINTITSNSIRLSSGDATYPLNYFDRGTYGSTMRDILVISAGSKYLANRVYTLTVDTTLSDVHGYKLSKPYVVNFTPEPQFRVTAASPTSSDVNLQYFGPVALSLNSAIDTNFIRKVQISPAIKGIWQIGGYYSASNDSTNAYFMSTDVLQYDTKYTVSVAGDAKDIHGLVINAPFQFSFTTVPFQVSLGGFITDVGTGGFTFPNNISFYSNGPIDTTTIRSSISISPQVTFTVNYSAYGTGVSSFIVILQRDQVLPNTTYHITIDTTLHAQNGVPVKKPFIYSFTTYL